MRRSQRFSRAVALMLLAFCLPLAPMRSMAWDGNWAEAPSGEFLSDPDDSTGKSGVSPDPRTYYSPAPRDYADVDPEELTDYYGRGRRPDYAPYALARITQTLHYGKDITIPIGYYLIKAGDAGDGSPKAHEPTGASGDKSLQQTGPKKQTGGAARPTGTIDPGAYPDSVGYLAIDEEMDGQLLAQGMDNGSLNPATTAPTKPGKASPSSQPQDPTAANGNSVDAINPADGTGNDPQARNLEDLPANPLDTYGTGMVYSNKTQHLKPGHSRNPGKLKQLVPPHLIDPYAPAPSASRNFRLPRVFIFKRLGRVVAVVPIHKVERFVPPKQGKEKIPPHPLVWVERENERTVMRMYDRQLLYSTYFE